MKLSIISKGDARKTTPDIAFEGSFEEFAENFKSYTPNKGKHDGYFVRGFLNGKRSNKNLPESDLLILDGDQSLENPESAPSPQILSAILQQSEINHFIYTTHSYAPPNKIKWRCVIPCAMEDKSQLKPTLAKMFAFLHDEEYPLKNVKENWTWSQPWFLPNRDEDDGHYIFIEYHKGNVYQPVTFVEAQEEPPILGKSEKAENSNIDAMHQEESTHEDNLAAIREGKSYYKELQSVIWGMVKDGRAYETVLADSKMIMLASVASHTDHEEHEKWAARYNELETYVHQAYNALTDEQIDEDDIPDFEEKAELIKELTWPPGAMGSLAENFFDMSPHPNKEMAIIGAFALISGIVGRHYNVNGTGLNIYSTLLADSGMGKSVIKDGINTAMLSADPMHSASYIGPARFTGPKAVFNSLSNGMSKICVFEESGLLSESNSGDQSGLTRVLLEAFASSGQGKVLGGEGYSDKNDSLGSLQCPALSIVNVSTPKSYLQAMKSKSADQSGEIARIWMTRTVGERPAYNRKRKRQFDEPHINMIRTLMQECSGHQDPDNFSEQVINMAIVNPAHFDDGDAWNEEYNKFRLQKDYIRMAMSSRAWVKVLKLAAVCSVYNGLDEIGDKEYDWAKKTIVDEVEFVTNTFTHDSTDDLLGMAKTIVGPAVSKILKASAKNPKSVPNNKLRSIGGFTLSNLNQAMRNNSALKELDDDVKRNNPKKGVEKIADYLVRNGYLMTLTETERKIYCPKSSKAYKVTDDFKMLIL